MTIIRLILAAALLLAASGVQAGGEGPRAASVAEMLQRKQEQQLREQLAREGRWKEIREIDEERVRQSQVQKKQSFTKINDDLARDGGVDTPVIDAMGTLCAPAAVPARLGRRFAAGSAAAEPGTMQVR